MTKEPVRIGRINAKTEKALEIDLKENIFCYITEARLREFVNKWPKDYLRKLEEASNIIKEPLYAGIDEENKLLYLIKDYIVKGKSFKKAGLVMSFKGQLQIQDIISFDDKKLEELSKNTKFAQVKYTRG